MRSGWRPIQFSRNSQNVLSQSLGYTHVGRPIFGKENRIRTVFLAAVMLLLCWVTPAQQPAPSPNWDAWKFLIGQWVGEGTGDVGEGVGYFTFEPDLNGKVLIRKNHAEYPATKDRAAYSHDDLMIVFADPATKQTRAFYTDSEGHVIHYSATFSTDGNTLTFLRTKPDRMALIFEIASPDQPDKFHKFIDATVRKSSQAANAGGR